MYFTLEGTATPISIPILMVEPSYVFQRGPRGFHDHKPLTIVRISPFMVCKSDTHITNTLLNSSFLMYKVPKHGIKVNKVATFHKLLIEFKRSVFDKYFLLRGYKDCLIL